MYKLRVRDERERDRNLMEENFRKHEVVSSV